MPAVIKLQWFIWIWLHLQLVNDWLSSILIYLIRAFYVLVNDWLSSILIYLIRTFFVYFCRLDQQTTTSIIMIWEILVGQSMFSVGIGRPFHMWNFCLIMNLLLHQQIVHCDYGMWRKIYQWVTWTKWFDRFFFFNLSYILYLICG